MERTLEYGVLIPVGWYSGDTPYAITNIIRLFQFLAIRISLRCNAECMPESLESVSLI